MALLLAFVIWLGWSVGHALTYPGGGTVSERLAEWARDHYLGPLVTFGEWITYKPPKVGGKPSFALTGPSAGPVSGPRPPGHPPLQPQFAAPAPLQPLVAHPLRGEGSGAYSARPRESQPSSAPTCGRAAFTRHMWLASSR